MPKTAETPGKPATHRVQVLLNEDDKALFDERRGTIPESTYARQIIQAALNTNLVAEGGKATDGHRHKPGKQVGSRTIKGVTTTAYECAQEGCTHRMERTS